MITWEPSTSVISTGSLRLRADHVGARRLVAGGDDGPGWQVLPGWWARRLRERQRRSRALGGGHHRRLLLGQVSRERIPHLRGIDGNLHQRIAAVRSRVVEGYQRAAQDAVFRTRFDVVQIPPSSVAKAATNTSPTTFFACVAALLTTAPAYEWATARTGPGVCSKTLAV